MIAILGELDQSVEIGARNIVIPDDLQFLRRGQIVIIFTCSLEEIELRNLFAIHAGDSLVCFRSWQIRV